MALFTPEELEELRRVDEEIDADFRLTNEDLRSSRKLDREAQLEAMDPDKRKVSAQQKAYREANREKVSAQKKAWYEANREKVSARQKAWYEANREAYNAYMREHMKKRRAANAATT